MTQRILWAMVVLPLFVTATARAQSKANQYQEILDRAHSDGIPAIAALIQSAEGQEWKGTAGVRNIEDGAPFAIDQSFRLASISKIFTAMIALQLADEKALQLLDPISEYLDEETKRSIPAIDQINILQLLSHSSGIYSFTENNSFWKECYANGGMSRTWSAAELISYIDGKKPVHQPAAAFSQKSYFNTNYILLGMIIEKVTGNSLATAYQKRIFEPIGMNHTFLEGYDNQERKPMDSYAIPNSAFLKSAMKKGGGKK